MATALQTPPLRPAGPSPVEGKLRGAWRRQRWYAHLRGLAPLLMLAIGLFLFDLLVDWLFDLPGFGRMVLLALNVVVLLWVGWRLWWRHLHRYDPVHVALQVERLHPHLKSLLVSYVQLNGASRGTAHGSPRLIEAMRGQAIHAATPLDFRGVVCFKQLRGLLAMATVLLALFLVSIWFFAPIYDVLVHRLFNPFSTRAYPTWTKIENVTGYAGIKLGDPIEIKAKAGGAVPEQGSLYVRFGDAPWEKIEIAKGDDNIFAQRFPRPSQSFFYYFRLGDARSETYHITVVPPPRIVAVAVTLRRPAYIDPKPELRDTLHLTGVPEGTAVEWEIHCDQKLAAGRMELQIDGTDPINLDIDKDDPRIARLRVADVGTLAAKVAPDKSTTAARSFGYHLHWKECVFDFEFADPTRYTMEIVSDRPPTVTLLKPRISAGQDRIVATVNKRLDMHFEARDDYGLGTVWVEYRLNDGAERRQQLGEIPPGEKHVHSDTHWTLKQTIPELKEGDEVALSLAVGDNRTVNGERKPNIGRSPVLRLVIVSDEEYRRYIAREKERGFDRTRDAVQEETEGSKKVKLLITNQGER
jgi:hypothetical protein